MGIAAVDVSSIKNNGSGGVQVMMVFGNSQNLILLQNQSTWKVIWTTQLGDMVIVYIVSDFFSIWLNVTAHW